MENNPFNKRIHDFSDYDKAEKYDRFLDHYQINGFLQYYLLWRSNIKQEDNIGKIFKEFLKYDHLARWRFSEKDFNDAKDLLIKNDRNTSYILKIPESNDIDLLIDIKEVLGFLAILLEEIKLDINFFAVFNVINSFSKYVNQETLEILKLELQYLYP
ncbi:hypothetical protein DpV84gp159 [Deerpox virus W-1170-84]|uniref:Uncharacterized protein n=1 Tax=Deerpox virus (strain W-1170-84) TaxID=305676 RepID=Q08F22_DPV84|nr:hypothetical protein DpV84gp159 [Deerpox virus W-1170-84]AUI80720.1 hypothetical protein [White-tailed deer poxvirus]AYC44698.1 hypothetical protein [Moosepox virus GoldyGopher14]